jgi:transposase-like protein
VVNLFKKRNEVVQEAKGRIPYWVIAERLGIHENTLQNWMKAEMEEERKDKVLRAIEEIKNDVRKGDV